MAQSISINITGTAKTVRGKLSKTIQMIYRNVDLSGDNIRSKSARMIANNVRDAAEVRAPSSVKTGIRKGGIKDNHIVVIPRANGKYLVRVLPSDRWGSSKSEKARRVYPLAQETGYRPHRVFVKWMPADSDIRKDIESQGGPYWITVNKFTPYLLPAFIYAVYRRGQDTEDVIKHELTAMIDRIKRKTTLHAYLQSTYAQQAFMTANIKKAKPVE